MKKNIKKENLTIEKITLDMNYAHDLLKQAEILQGEAFLEPASSWIPAHKLIGSIDNGGIVIASYIKNKEKKELIAFLEASPAIKVKLGRAKPYLYMHIMAVHPEIKKIIRGIGEEMLLYLRRTALVLGYDMITWTYDPLLGENANLYIKKCGAIADEYVVEKYALSGQFQEVPADRFIVKWLLNSSLVMKRINEKQKAVTCKELLEGSDVPFVNKTSINKVFYRANKELKHDMKNPVIAVEIPSNFLNMCIHEKKLAARWRRASRAIFPVYFKKGYKVFDFITNYEKGINIEDARSFYLLKKN